ncbi:hypothetical protein VaNZ11_006321 [Volvox africanus]|uniref:Uncharacterized protein n=1 Tax=Volvox africanus TaxID=51714 RepID=A0ABQ5S0L4_9CHLO|nr:hypothetical protein VaNZ11_006321 [Volvox africanus]
MEAPTTDLKTAKRVSKDGKPSRRSMDFWCQFNYWYRNLWEAERRRPTVVEVKRWYDEAADSCWGDQKPTWEETRTHSKCLRSLDQVRTYFRQYRAARKEASKSDIARSAYPNNGLLQQDPNLTNLTSISHEDGTAMSTVFFCDTNLRRASTTNSDISTVTMHFNHSQEYAPSHRVASTSGLSGFVMGANESGVATERPLSGVGFTQSGVGTWSRTISTGAVFQDPGQSMSNCATAAQTGVCVKYGDTGARPQPSSIVYAATGDATALSIPVSPPSSSSHQQAGTSWQQQPAHQRGAYYYATLHGSAAHDAEVPARAQAVLQSMPTDARTTSPQRVDLPACSPTLPLPQSHPVPGRAGVRPSAVTLPGDHLPPTLQKAGSGEAMIGCAVLAGTRVTDVIAERQQPHARTQMQAPGKCFNVAGSNPNQRQQQQYHKPPVAPATQAAALMPAQELLAYQHNHHVPVHHPMTYMGYDPMLGHPAYMDPYAYSYGMHDPGADYWRMYPYWYETAHLYPDLASHMPGYRILCDGSMHMQNMPQCPQQSAAAAVVPPQLQPPAVKNYVSCPAGTAHYASVLQHQVEGSTNGFELAGRCRCASVPLLQQPDASTSVRIDVPSVCDDDTGVRSSGTASARLQAVSPFPQQCPVHTIGAGNIQPNQPCFVQGNLEPGSGSALSAAAGFISPRTSALFSELDMLYTDGVYDCSL